MNNKTQSPAEVPPLRVVGRYMNVSHEMDSNWNISPKMSCVLECDIVMLQNDMLMIL